MKLSPYAPFTRLEFWTSVVTAEVLCPNLDYLGFGWNYLLRLIVGLTILYYIWLCKNTNKWRF